MVDILKIMIVNVTQGHIDKGTPLTTNACAVAWALSDAGFKNVYVNKLNFYFDNGGGRDKSDFPMEVVMFMEDATTYALDDSIKPKPFSFEIEKPPQ